MTASEAIKVIKSECYVFNPLNFDRTRFVNTALDKAVEALEQTQWIPVTQQPPEVDGRYLVTIHNSLITDVQLAWYAEDIHDAAYEEDDELPHERGWYTYDGDSVRILPDVVAWQELPLPYYS